MTPTPRQGIAVSVFEPESVGAFGGASRSWGLGISRVPNLAPPQVGLSSGQGEELREYPSAKGVIAVYLISGSEFFHSLLNPSTLIKLP
jgi:hypothetical protein